MAKNADTESTTNTYSAVQNPGAAATLAALFCFSAGPVGIAVQKLLVASFSPFLIIAIQMTAGALVLWLVFLCLLQKPVARSAAAKGVLLGVLHPGAFMIIYTAASGHLDSVTAVLLLAPIPAAVAILGRLLLKEALKPPVMVGLGASLVGLMVLVSERQATGESEPIGYLLGLAGLVIAAFGIVGGRAMNARTALPWYLLAPLQVTGAAMVAWIGVVGSGAPVDLVAIAAQVLPFAYLALGMTAASYFAYNFALSRLEAGQIGLISSAGPGIGALAAAVLFGTTIGPVAAIGIAIILAGVALPSLVERWRRRRSRRREDATAGQ